VVVGYSDCDALSLHVKLADEAVRLGPSPASMSYLDIDAVLRAAKDSGCDAVFPGYGFLAENPTSRRRWSGRGLSSSAVRPRHAGPGRQDRGPKGALGLRRAGDPALEDVDDPRKVVAFGDRVGWPILIKASAGGGGKGMQKVFSAEEVEESLASARSVAEKAFGKGTVFVEKFIGAVAISSSSSSRTGSGTSSTSASANAPSSGGTRSWWRRRRAPC